MLAAPQLYVPTGYLRYVAPYVALFAHRSRPTCVHPTRPKARDGRLVDPGCRRLPFPFMSERTRLRRLPDKGSHDRAVINEILDEALICHFGFVRDGYPVVLPTIHARVGEILYIHGSKAAGNLRTLKEGIEVCLTVTIVDGIVAARSLFEHSMHYRSAVLFGKGRLVDGPEERITAFRAITERIIPGRWDDARQPSPAEDRQTTIIAIKIDEASAKIGDGWPDDPDEDLDLGVWAGVIPIAVSYGQPIPDPRLDSAIGLPDYISKLVEPID